MFVNWRKAESGKVVCLRIPIDFPSIHKYSPTTSEAWAHLHGLWLVHSAMPHQSTLPPLAKEKEEIWDKVSFPCNPTTHVATTRSAALCYLATHTHTHTHEQCKRLSQRCGSLRGKSLPLLQWICCPQSMNAELSAILMCAPLFLPLWK